jgi:hypothetical protein
MSNIWQAVQKTHEQLVTSFYSHSPQKGEGLPQNHQPLTFLLFIGCFSSPSLLDNTFYPLYLLTVTHELNMLNVFLQKKKNCAAVPVLGRNSTKNKMYVQVTAHGINKLYGSNMSTNRIMYNRWMVKVLFCKTMEDFIMELSHMSLSN